MPDGHIKNPRNGKVLDVSGGRDKDNQSVIQWRSHNGKNQKWTIIYYSNRKPKNLVQLDDNSTAQEELQ